MGNLHEIKKEKNEENEQPNLLIGTPAFGCMMHTDYHHLIINLIKMGLKFDNMTIGNQSLICRARNTIASYFLDNKQYTHLLFIDADIGMPPMGIITLLQRNVDVIGAPVALKGLNPDGSPVLNYGKVLKTNVQPGLISVEHIGTAVFMMSRKAVEDLAKASDQYNHDPKFSRGNQLNNVMYDMFPVGVVDGNYLSEDYYACKLLREQGYDIHVDMTIPVIHNGMFQFGNGVFVPGSM